MESLQQRWVLPCAATAYTLLLAFNIAHHEPWADEAQAWLLARDSHLLELWTRLLRYEGSPGLWHTLLYFCIRLGVPYAGMNVISGLAGLAAVVLLLRYAPFPLPIRLLLPFTFFLAYQYAVIARNYSLAPLLLFACAIAYKGGVGRNGTVTVLLGLLAAVSAQAFLLSVSIWLVFQMRIAGQWRALNLATKKRTVQYGLAYLFVLLVVAALVWPNRDITFVRVPNWSPRDFFMLTRFAFQQAFGEGFLPLLVIGLTAPFLWKSGGWLLFLLPSFLLCVFGAVVYASYWHWGFLFLAWLFALWVASANTKPTLPVVVALGTVIVVGSYWTFASTRYDWKHSYSGSLAAAHYIRKSGLAGQSLFAIGFSSVGVQPYFPKNVFANFNSGQDRAYWDWSRRNRTNDAIERLGSSRPDYVLAGYLWPPEKQLWTHLITASGYQRVKYFEGQIYWRTNTVQPDSFDLYRRSAQVRDCLLRTAMDVADPKAEDQLVSGFYDVSDHSWRWTARKFAVVLQRPDGSAESGARLCLRFFVPDNEIRMLGSLQIAAQIAAYRLRSMTVHKGGSYQYVADVPKGALFTEILFVNFILDKAMPPSQKDARELGVVVSSVQLTRE